MASKASAVAIPTTDGVPKMADAVAVKSGGGQITLSPLPLSGGRRRKSRKLSKKALKMMKKMTPKQIKKMLKGGEEGMVAEGEEAPVGARRRRSTRRGRGMFY